MVYWRLAWPPLSASNQLGVQPYRKSLNVWTKALVTPEPQKLPMFQRTEYGTRCRDDGNDLHLEAIASVFIMELHVHGNMPVMKKWLIGLGVGVTVIFAGLLITARVLAGRAAPLIRAQTIEYLEKQFDSDVEIGALDVSMAMKSPLLVLLSAGKGAQAHVQGENVKLWRKHRRDRPPLIAMKRFQFEVELNSLLTTTVN